MSTRTGDYSMGAVFVSLFTACAMLIILHLTTPISPNSVTDTPAAAEATPIVEDPCPLVSVAAGSTCRIVSSKEISLIRTATPTCPLVTLPAAATCPLPRPTHVLSGITRPKKDKPPPPPSSPQKDKPPPPPSPQIETSEPLLTLEVGYTMRSRGSVLMAAQLDFHYLHMKADAKRMMRTLFAPLDSAMINRNRSGDASIYEGHLIENQLLGLSEGENGPVWITSSGKQINLRKDGSSWKANNVDVIMPAAFISDWICVFLIAEMAVTVPKDSTSPAAPPPQPLPTKFWVPLMEHFLTWSYWLDFVLNMVNRVLSLKLEKFIAWTA